MIDKVKSPCVNICNVDTKSGLCVGCRRTMLEIASWSSLNNLEKEKILLKIKNRILTNQIKTSSYNQEDCN